MTTSIVGGSSPSRPRILFLDAYDSFSNNITALLATLLGADVHVLPIDAPLDRDAFCAELACYDAIVCGPGPGSPNCPADIGLMKHVWAAHTLDANATATHSTPALGICLGFQSLVLAHGGRIRRLRSGGLHGMVRPVEVNERAADIFSGVAAPFRATLYHSLGADMGQDDIADVDWPTARWMLSTPKGDLVPLAWVDEREDASLGGTSSERLLMGVRHRSLPFWGLQYHPESVCTDAASHTVLVNWFRAALTWNVEHGRVRAEPSTTLASRGGGLAAHQATRPSLLSLQPSVLGEATRHTTNGRGANGTNGHGMTMLDALRHQTPSRFVSQTIPLPSHVEVPDIVEALQVGRVDGSEPEQMILDSASAASGTNHTQTEDTVGDDDTANDEAIRGRFSIIALDVGAALRIEYRTGDRFASIRLPRTSPDTVNISLQETQTIWQLLAEVHESRRLPQEDVAAATHSRASPFLGGFMGYVSYEQGLGDIGVPLPGAGDEGGGRGHNRPDVCFAWVTKSIVVDHVLGVVHVQHLEAGATHANGTSGVSGVGSANGARCTHGRSNANGQNGKAQSSWVDGVAAQLQTSKQWQSAARTSAMPTSIPTSPMLPRVVHTQLPDVQAYEHKVRACQEHIAAGDAYELCLTDETRIATASPAASSCSSSSAWNYYRLLRKKNPAPFASFLRLGGATLVSSSPERFLCFSPRMDDDGRTDGSCAGTSTLCSMRPMKGTVRRSAAVATLAQAEALLHVPKEEAENLMIVDLVRHDLHGVCGPGHVTVPRLLQVEPYGHVFQMVTVVEGALAAQRGYTGLDVLAASLPPGSMTGAPKKRSCALLRALEERPPSPRSGAAGAAPGERSLYSGVVGYLCVSGRGDWSVTIRSLFRWDDETTFVDSSSDRDNGSGAETTRQDVWHIGAGGAVTILSTPEGERDEMFVKLSRPLSIFE
ncbi:para-aminobenzoate synthase [Sporothrix brasiliensis 5110]|uniref:aminodeoxychorismate synthase n=1 Tax=Sporothrix brasiliensis 5110 TaxID=1398154 RepID=A0A0C2F7Q4_9PEZI|nr:para-aminobenzoate synthase [Sporothrix brasiliensis 5110]KIH95049.1 para-aminobenzoate synthase [Sporothrix brasiliensis 5110]